VKRISRTAHSSRRDETGAVLILALIYIIVISVTVAALTGWATNDLNNSSHFASASELQMSASAMTDVAIQYVRYNPEISTSQAEGQASPLVACWGSNSLAAIPKIDGTQVAVWCSTVWNPLSQVTRDVTFYACPISVLAAACATPGNTLLTTEVYYDDYPTGNNTAPIQVLCTVWCGEGMTINSSTWGSSAAGTVTGIANNMSFSTEPSDTTVNTATSAQVTVLDSSGNAVAGDSVTLVEQSGPQNGLATASTLVAITNTSGVASFTNLLFNQAGSYTLTATDGTVSTVSTTSTNVVVSPGANSISVTSSAPSAATVDGALYYPTATATSGDTVVVGSNTPTVCTVANGQTANPSVSFILAGQCTLSFNDTGAPNYVAATNSQTFQVIPATPTQVVIRASSSTPSANSTTNDQLSFQLEDARGNPTTSSGTTTLTLGDSGNGFFASSNNASGSGSASVSFTNGVGTATEYFGNETAGSDTITAKNGASSWGTVSVTVQPGTAVQVAITSTTSSPAVNSKTNDQLSLQLEDAYGNAAGSPGAQTLTLSDSGNGFFASSNGVVGAATLNVSFANGVGTATAYFGNQTSGSDTISAIYGGNTTVGTTIVSPVAGAATQATVTISPTTPAKSTSTNASVTLQLEDQYGNRVLTSGVQLVLSDSGSGYFATSSGVSSSHASSTLTITTNSSGVAVGYFGDNTDSGDTMTATKSGATWGTKSFSI
jgi:hypothetical protein